MFTAEIAEGAEREKREGVDRGFTGLNGFILSRRREEREEKGKNHCCEKAQYSLSSIDSRYSSGSAILVWRGIQADGKRIL